jgi:hypothetical protein
VPKDVENVFVPLIWNSWLGRGGWDGRKGLGKSALNTDRIDWRGARLVT